MLKNKQYHRVTEVILCRRNSKVGVTHRFRFHSSHRNPMSRFHLAKRILFPLGVPDHTLTSAVAPLTLSMESARMWRF